MLRAGELRQRVSIQTRTETSDGHDGYTESWATVHSRWPAMVAPLVGRDLERARQIDPRLSHHVTLRYWLDYATDLKGGRARLVYHDVSDRTFEVIGPAIDHDERHEMLTFTCREVA
jgi:SPP1 family predicted phage head-tail adaptor